MAYEPFYRPLDGPSGQRFLATSATVGPWSDADQHVGPPTALLVRACERLGPPSAGPVARLTVDVLGPVPVGEVTVSAHVERPGRTVELVAAELVAAGRAVLRLRAWRIAGGDTARVAGLGGRVVDVPPAPDTLPEGGPPGPGWRGGFLDAMEWRWVRGGLAVPGPGTAWGRQRGALVDGEDPTPLQRLLPMADSTNGIAAPLDIRGWLFVNTELTVHLHRAPRGEWIGVDAHTVVGPDGTGTASATLFDERGHVGRAAQALLVRAR